MINMFEFWGWFHYFCALYMRKEANMNIYLDQQQSVLSKTAKAKAFTSKEQICPSADWREWAKCRERGNIEELYLLAHFNIFQIYSWKKCWPPIELWIWIPGINCLYSRLVCCEEVPWKPLSVEIEDWREGEVGILEQFGSSRAKVMSAHIFFCTKWSKREKGWYDSAIIK